MILGSFSWIDIGKLLGLKDATIAALMVIYPIQEERKRLQVCILSVKTMSQWRSLDFLINLQGSYFLSSYLQI